MKHIFIFFIGLLVLLTGCNNGKSQKAILLEIDFGVSVAIKEGRNFTLTPTISNENEVEAYSWVQVSGPTLMLEGEHSRNLTIRAPSLLQDEKAEVKLTIKGKDGLVVSKVKLLDLVANRVPQIHKIEGVLTEKQDSTLNVLASDSDGVITDISWQQISGPVVSILSNTGSSIKIKAPAVTDSSLVEFSIIVTDDDGDTTYQTKTFTIESTLENYDIGGFLVAGHMDGANLIGSVGGQASTHSADLHSGYQLTFKLDDDHLNDFAIIRAISTTKPGMDLWTMVPSLRELDLQQPLNLTAYSTAMSALVVRANKGVVPANLEQLKLAEQAVELDDLLKASLLIYAYSMRSEMSLPAGYSSIFSVIVNKTAFETIYKELEDTKPSWLDEVESTLSNHILNQIPVSGMEYLKGVVLQPSLNSELGLSSGEYYQLNSDHTGQLLNRYSSFFVNWGILNNSIQTSVTPQHVELKLDIRSQVLSLDALRISKLEEQGIPYLKVILRESGEQLTRFTNGSTKSLFKRRSYSSYSIPPIRLKNEIFEFFDIEIENIDYVWAKDLTENYVSVVENEMLGQWLVPIFRENVIDDSVKFEDLYVSLLPGKTGYIENDKEFFTWDIAVDIHGKSALLLQFSHNYTHAIQLVKKLPDGFEAFITAIDPNGTKKVVLSERLLKLPE